MSHRMENPLMKNFACCATLLAAVSLSAAPRVFSAESAKSKASLWDAERREAEQEDQNFSQLSLEEQARACRTFRGMLELTAGDNPDVVGTFYELQNGNGAAVSAIKYAVKLQNKALLAQLKNYGGKKVEVEGKLRNAGKYLVIARIVEKSPGPPRYERRAFGGL